MPQTTKPPQGPRSGPRRKLAINADEVASGAGVRFPVEEGMAAIDAEALAPKSEYAARLMAIFEEEAADLARLNALIDEEPEPMARLDLERKLSERQQRTEILVMELQLERARREGLEAAVQELEASIEELLHPTPAELKYEVRERKQGE